MEDQTYESKLAQIHHIVSMVGTVITPEEAIDMINGYFLELEYWRKSNSVVIMLPTFEQALQLYNEISESFIPRYLQEGLKAAPDKKGNYPYVVTGHATSLTLVGRTKNPEDEINWDEHVPFKTKEELDEAFRANGWPEVDFESK